MIINDYDKHHQYDNEFDLRLNEVFRDKNQIQQMQKKQTRLLLQSKEQDYFLLVLVLSWEW